MEEESGKLAAGEVGGWAGALGVLGGMWHFQPSRLAQVAPPRPCTVVSHKHPWSQYPSDCCGAGAAHSCGVSYKWAGGFSSAFPLLKARKNNARILRLIKNGNSRMV